MKKLYSVNPQERIILDKAKEGDIDLFMDFYFRSPTSGTWWLPGTKTEHWSTGYNRLLREWERSGKPDDKFTSEHNEVTYRVTMQHEMSKQYPGLPAFHHNHGILMLDWQKDLHNDRHPFRTIAGGFGCLHPDTLIEGRSVKDWADSNEAPVVTAFTGSGFVKVKASVPFKKGSAKLYRVNTTNRSIVVTADHRFLTDGGWLSLSDGELLHVSLLSLRESSWESVPSVYLQGAERWTGRDSGYPGDYSQYFRPDDVRLQTDRVISPVFSPLPAGVPERSLHYSHGDAPWQAPAHSRSCPQSARHSSRDSFGRIALPAKTRGCFCYEGIFGDAHVIPSYSQNLWLEEFQNSSFQPQPFVQSQYDVAQNDFVPDVPLYMSLPEAACEYIVSIEEMQEGDYYDLHVPGYENYVAEGLIHHNSGKTLAVVLSFLIHAATLPGYRGLALAPFSKQAKEVYILALSAIRNTKYEERFLRGTPASPFPTLIVGNDYTNTENTIECYGIGDKDDADKLRTLTADNALIDQAEKIMDLQSVIRDVGTRFRGRELTSGRSRIGTMTFLANSGINDELWNLYDKADENPDKYFSFSPSTYDNIYLTDADIERYELQVGEGEDNKRMYMYGGRPLGDGSEFSRVIMDRVRDPSLDELHEHLTRLGQKTTRIETPGSGVTEWTLPYDPTRFYVVVSDPGTDAPPHRNSPAIMVWDVSKFDIDHPMTLSAYYWFNGRRDISTWANTYATVVSTYHAIGRNGFDATGYQKGYDRWMQTLHNLIPEKFELTASNKPMMLNDAKMLSSRGLIRMPMAVTSIYNQLAFYEYPEPEKLKQDLVMVYIMSAYYAKRLFYMSFQKEETRKFNEWVLEDRNSREMDVYSQRTAR